MKKYLSFLFVCVAVISICISCSKSNEITTPNNLVKDSVAAIINYSIEGISPQISITSFAINIRFPDTVFSGENLVASFTLSPGAEASINGIKQVSGTTKNSFNSFLNYSIKNQEGFIKHWIVTSTNNDYTYNWGLGNFLKQSLSNDRSYNWYYTQGGTGTYSLINCCPTSVTMSMKWADSTFNGTPQQARNYFPQNTDLWGLHTIQDYLDAYKFPNKQLQLGGTPEETKSILKAQLDAGNIVILLLNTGSIRSYLGGSTDPRADKYYGDNFNHSIVTYGYKEVDNEFFFQVNDPWNFSWVNSDGTPKGKSRFYRYEDIFYGCLNNDNFAQIVYKK